MRVLLTWWPMILNHHRGLAVHTLLESAEVASFSVGKMWETFREHLPERDFKAGADVESTSTGKSEPSLTLAL